MTTLPALENAFMRYTELRGRLNCSMLSGAKRLQRLSFSGNGDIVGELLGCFFQVRCYIACTSSFFPQIPRKLFCF